MKTIATLYELLPDEMQAFLSEDGFTLKIEGCPQVILRGPQNGAGVEEDRPVSSSGNPARNPSGKYLCKQGCGELFDSMGASAAHSRYRHPKNNNGAVAEARTLTAAQRTAGFHGHRSGEFICRPCNNRVFKYRKAFYDHQEKKHGVKISSGLSAADSLAASRGAGA